MIGDIIPLRVFRTPNQSRIEASLFQRGFANAEIAKKIGIALVRNCSIVPLASRQIVFHWGISRKMRRSISNVFCAERADFGAMRRV